MILRHRTSMGRGMLIDGGRRLVAAAHDRLNPRHWSPSLGRRYVAVAVAVAVLSAAMLPIRNHLGVLNVLLIYLLLCFVLALTAGSGPAAGAALLAFLAFDFFFIPPLHTFSVARSDHVLALFVFLGVAIVTGQLVARVQTRTEVALREQRRTSLLYELNAALIGDVTLAAILATIVERVVHIYGAASSRIALPDDAGRLVIRASHPTGQSLEIDRQKLAMATWAIEHSSPAGLRTEGRHIHVPHGIRRPVPGFFQPRETDVLYLPIATSDHVVGVLEVLGRPGGGRFGADDEAILTSFANQAALALERARLSEEAARAAVLAQSDELKSALLSAVSHDLRTPLATIKASATSLLDGTVQWSDDARGEFLEAINEETDRLSLMVANLLDLSRIEGGALRPDREWYDIAELIEDVAHRLGIQSAGHPLTTQIEPNLPLLWFDYVEIAQVLVNLGENAIKYTPPGTAIDVSARRVVDAIEFAVRDYGPGIPARATARLFEKFYRVNEQTQVPGTGIGLTICMGLVEAHGGRIWVNSREGVGTTIHFTIPVQGDAADGG